MWFRDDSLIRQWRGRADPADRRARRLYLKAKAKPLVDDIWHLVELTRPSTHVSSLSYTRYWA
jgi:hypothetical protein